MKKNMVLSILSIILAVSMLTMTGCGGGGGSAADPVAGNYTCVSQKFAVDGSGAETPDHTLVLEAGGKGKSKRNGTEYELTWELSGTTFKMSEKFLGMTNDYSGTLSDNTITVYNGDPKAPLTYEYVFIKDGTGGASSADMSGLANLLGGGGNTGNVSAASATVYECVKAEMYGVEMAVEDLVPGGASIELSDDGTALFHYGADDHQMKWTQTGSKLHMEDQYNAMDGTLENGVLVLNEVFGSSMSLTFAGDGADTGSAAGTGTQPAASGLDESTMKVIEDFEGDWYGMVRINHAYDGYSDHQDAEMYATARFSFDEQGEVTAYFCASVSPLAANFLNVTARTSPQIESVVVNFDFFEGHTKDDAYFRIDRGLLNTTANIINDDGDEMDISMVFRRIGDEWTENERTVYWKYAAEYAHLAVGETAETLAAAWCDDEYPKPVPALSNIAGGGTGAAPSGGTQNAGAGQQGGGTDFASAGPAGNAVMDYENKGVIFFNYDDSVFTFRNSVFDGLETPYEDGNVRITFHAEYEDGLEARHKWLDDYSDQPEYRSEETTIAGLPARVVHLIDSTMFNDPYMYVLIDLRGTQEKYEDIFITVRGNSFEDIDADRVYAIINSIHFEP